MGRSKLNILVSGMMAADLRQGGATWAVLQYVLGLRRLGHEVWFVEPVPPARVQPAGSRIADSDNAAYLREVAAGFDLEDRCALLLLQDTRDTAGMSYATIRKIA